MLSGSVPDVSLSDIATSGNDVYILGVQKTSPVLRDAILWKNGSATIIPLANNNSASNFYIAVQNNDVYIVTNEYAPATSLSRIMYYKNNDAPVAITSTKNAVVKEITVGNNGDVYIAGFQLNANNTFEACYWKNGTKVIVSNTINLDAGLQSIFIKNTDIYACGTTLVNATPTITYWKNGTASVLNSGSLSSYPKKIIVN